VPISILHVDGVVVATAPIRDPKTRSSSALTSEDFSPATWLNEPGSLINRGWWGALDFDALCAHSVVRRALLKHADAESTIRIKTYDQRTKSRQVTRGAPGQFSDLLLKGSVIGHHRLRHWIAFNRRKYGAAYVALIRNENDVPVEMIPVHPVLLSWDASTGTYIFHASSGPVVLQERDIHVFPNYLGSSGTIRSGVSSLETLRVMVESDQATAEAARGWWKRGARPGMILRHPGRISKPARENLTESWSVRHEGANNAGRTALLEEGMDATVLPFNAEQAALVETRQQNWEEACVALDVTPAMVHLHQNSTFSNVTELHKAWYREIVAPQLRFLEDDWGRLAIEMGAEILVEHDVDSILWGTPLDRAEALRYADWLTLAEKRQIENLEAIDGTDRILVNAANVPFDRLDEWIDRSGPSQAPSNTSTATAKAVWSRKDADTVLGSLSRLGDLTEIDMDQVTSGLPDRCAESFGVLAATASSLPQLRKMLGALTIGGSE
jgi:HK97 family phage portal protein